MIDALLCFSVGRGTWTTRHSERVTTRKGFPFAKFRRAEWPSFGFQLVFLVSIHVAHPCSSELKRARSYFGFYR